MKYFFIGIAGAGMSAVAQYLNGKGADISGSDRLFLSPDGDSVKQKLEASGIKCYPQGSALIDKGTDFVVVSTAIEDNVPEYKFAKENSIRIIHRSDLLAEICNKNYTIAVSGTSGKSTVTAMIFDILLKCGKEPSLITGAGLISLQNKGLIGNAYVGKSDILVIEVDESDGTIVKYSPQIGLILNIDKDHKEISELIPLFETFKKNTKQTLIVNLDNKLSRQLGGGEYDFSCEDSSARNYAENFSQTVSGISFTSNNQRFMLDLLGRHNMENALAAVSVARLFDISDKEISEALSSYQGIYRRGRIVFNEGGVMLMDDFAHNPAKISAAVSACQAVGERVLAWFQPHGFKPSKMMKQELIERLSLLLRKDDVMIFSKIFYAGGTADMSISAEEFSKELLLKGKNSLYIPDREFLIPFLKENIRKGDVVLLMGARDTTLGDFALEVKNALSDFISR